MYFIGWLCSCSNIEERMEPTIEARVQSGIKEGISTMIAGFTEVSTNTPYPTYTLYPTLTPNPTYTPDIIIVTATYTSTPEYTPTITLTPTDTATASNTPDFTKSDKTNGFYLVGSEMAPGIWRSNGTQDYCYWEITTSTGDIINNHFGMAGGTMYVPSSGFQVMLEDCGTWTYIGN
jgi:hypothetical protein